MIIHPFGLLKGSNDDLAVVMTTKRDHEDEQAIAQATGATGVVALHQVHGNRCVVVRGPEDRLSDADAALTHVPNLLLTIRTADCQSFALFDPINRVCGVIHAGWRGLVSGVIMNTVVMMRNEFGTDAHDVLVGAGPSLCMRCAEFTDPTRELTGIDTKFFHGRCADLRSIADEQLRSSGIADDHLERSPLCTRCNHDDLWSYRADKAGVEKGGRNLLACMLR